MKYSREGGHYQTQAVIFFFFTRSSSGVYIIIRLRTENQHHWYPCPEVGEKQERRKREKGKKNVLTMASYT